MAGRLAVETFVLRARTRLTVAGETLTWWCRVRCQAMACGPASSPCLASSLRSRMMRSTVSGLVTDGKVFGRRDRDPSGVGADHGEDVV